MVTQEVNCKVGTIVNIAHDDIGPFNLFHRVRLNSIIF